MGRCLRGCLYLQLKSGNLSSLEGRQGREQTTPPQAIMNLPPPPLETMLLETHNFRVAQRNT